MGSYKVGVISRVPVVITHIRGLITPLITTREPPSNPEESPEEAAKFRKIRLQSLSRGHLSY